MVNTPATVKDAIATLGGRQCVAQITRKSVKAVYHWQTANTFPANLYLVIRAALRKSGCQADERLFSFVPIDEAAP